MDFIKFQKTVFLLMLLFMSIGFVCLYLTVWVYSPPLWDTGMLSFCFALFSACLLIASSLGKGK